MILLPTVGRRFERHECHGKRDVSIRATAFLFRALLLSEWVTGGSLSPSLRFQRGRGHTSSGATILSKNAHGRHRRKCMGLGRHAWTESEANVSIGGPCPTYPLPRWRQFPISKLTNAEMDLPQTIPLRRELVESPVFRTASACPNCGQLSGLSPGLLAQTQLALSATVPTVTRLVAASARPRSQASQAEHALRSRSRSDPVHHRQRFAIERSACTVLEGAPALGGARVAWRSAPFRGIQKSLYSLSGTEPSQCPLGL